jgi:hypothetical protein
MKIVRSAALLTTLLLAAVLLSPALQAQAPGAAADKGEEAAKAECKAKSDPSILVNYWKTAAGAAPADAAALAEQENRARRICVTQGGGNSRSYTIAGNAGPMKVTGTACSLAKPFTVKGSGGGMYITFSYAPGSEAGGSVSYTGGGTGPLAMVHMAGKGSYTVKLGHAHRHLEAHAHGPVLAARRQRRAPSVRRHGRAKGAKRRLRA